MTMPLHINRPRCSLCLLSFSIHNIPWVLITPIGHAHEALVGKWPWHCISTGQDGCKELTSQWANGHNVANLQAKPIPINLIWSESAHWSGNFGVRKILRALIFIVPMVTPIMPRWANDHDLTRLHAKTVVMNLIWSESTHWLLSSGVHKIPEVLITPMGTPIMPPCANCHDVAHLQAKAFPMNFIWSELAHWLPRSGIHKIPGAHITHNARMGIWPWRCTSTGQYGSSELNLEWIGQGVAEFRRPLVSRSPYFNMPKGTPMWPSWANDYNTACLQTKMVPMNLIRNESAQSLMSNGVRKFWDWQTDAVIGDLRTQSLNVNSLRPCGVYMTSMNFVISGSGKVCLAPS